MSKFEKPKGYRLTGCTSPSKAWLSKELNRNGNRFLVFSSEKALFPKQPIFIPCRQCMGCRMSRSVDWAIRSELERKGHDASCFLTLTYDAEHLPESGSLVKADHQLFIRKLRKEIAPVKVRFMMCGEYGPLRERPHFHFCLYGYDFPDRVPIDLGSNGDVLYRSDLLDRVWGKGLAKIGSLTFQSSAYVARYILKKQLGKYASAVDPETGLTPYQRRTESGEVVDLLPEYSQVSNRPGLGFEWFSKFYSEVFPKGTVVVNGRELPAPAYFLRKLEDFDPDLFAQVKKDRQAFAAEQSADPEYWASLDRRRELVIAMTKKARERRHG